MSSPADPRLNLEGEQLADPYARFDRVWKRAQAVDPGFHDAVCLASVGDDGRPSARMVLLKAFDARGFVFFTNFHSRKGREILAHPEVALCFHWAGLQEQVRVEGTAQPVDVAEADAYFASRPRGSQEGAWASHQSAVLTGRNELEDRLAAVQAQYAGSEVPRPPHWSGFRVTPRALEFWIGMPSRLHHRAVYTPDGAGGWAIKTLSP